MSSGFFAPSTLQKEKPVGLVPKCGACQIFKTCQSPKMPVYGRGKAEVLVVGEAPGETEDEQGRPFIGKAGQFLRANLEAIGVDLDEDCWSTSALICHPRHNATPDEKQIGYCRPNLIRALEKLQPRVVVLLGRSAVGSLMPLHWKDDIGPLERWVGWQIPAPDYWICPTYHPSYLLRSHNQMLDRLFQQHLAKAFAIDSDPPVLSIPKIDLLYDIKDIEQALIYFARQEWAAFDYEGNCLKPEYPDARLYSCAVSDGERVASFPWGGRISNHMIPFLRSKVKKIASNLKFEERWSVSHAGTEVANWGWDTMLAAHCLDNRQGICSLKFQSWVKLGVATYNAHIDPYLKNSRGHYNNIDKISLPDLLTYGGMDGVLEYWLAMRQRKEMGF